MAGGGADLPRGIESGNATFESEPPAWEAFEAGRLRAARFVALGLDGIGTALLNRFLDEVDRVGIWTVQSSIFPENAPSLALHDRAGFRRVGHRERIARMTRGPWAGQWRDTILIERRRPDRDRHRDP